jgi:hypothetical protein
MDSVTQFKKIFVGLATAYGYYRIEKTENNGKNTGKGGVVREPPTDLVWENHLKGKTQGLGIIPINADNQCQWGAIDVDQYPLDHKLLVEKIRRMKLPLVVCRSKSGGAHCYLFANEWVDAADMQKALQKEVNIVAKQLQRKDYAYKCSDAPINSCCNRTLCQTRKFGIGALVAGAEMANLRKYNSTPPVWFLDINGEPLELDTEALLNQATFQKSCMEQLNFMPRSVQKQSWEGRIGALMSEMRENDTAIIDVAEDASTSGQFYDYLEEFCRHLQQAQDREEILLRRPWTDEENGLTYFRLKDLEAFLRKNKFFEYKSHKIAQRLRDKNGESVVLKIKGRAVRVWQIPAFESADVSLATPQFNTQETPF